ncbi:MAG: S1C family serine protease [Verrucomicrobiota bacterium]
MSWLILAVVLSTVHLSAGVIDEIGQEVQKVFDKASPSVVRVRGLGAAKPLAGTGFFIDGHGTVVTSYNVVHEARKAWIEYQDKKIEAQIYGRDIRSGIAVLKTDLSNTPHLKFGDSTKLAVAKAVIAVAYPFDLPAAPSFGIVTGFDARYLNYFFATTYVRTSLKVKPGQIGGPLLNSKGEIVGMLALAIQNGTECYSIPIKSAQKVIDDLLETGEAEYGWVGVGVVEGKPRENGDRPVRVSQLYDGAPAAKSGLAPGDVILKIGDQAIKHPSDVLDVAFFSSVGDKLDVLVERDGKEEVFSFPVVARPNTSPLVRPVPAHRLPDGYQVPRETVEKEDSVLIPVKSTNQGS